MKKADFVKSSASLAQCPKTEKPEYAFIGRSNVGKSSLINMLAGRKQLAKISATPGKTQLINHFLVDDTWYLVDLPGYGYAKVSKSERKKWEDMINNYLMHRKNLSCVMVLIDIRHEPQRNDLDFIQWLGENGIPFVLIFTKADKLTPNKIAQSVARYKKTLLRSWEELPAYFVSSAVDRRGKEEILDFIGRINQSVNHK